MQGISIDYWMDSMNAHLSVNTSMKNLAKAKEKNNNLYFKMVYMTHGTGCKGTSAEFYMWCTSYC